MPKPEIVPFSLIVENGLPDQPINHYDRQLSALRDQVNSLVRFNGSNSGRGCVARGLATGTQQYVPNLGSAIEPMPQHGVTFHKPELLTSDPRSDSSAVRDLFHRLVLAALKPSIEIGTTIEVHSWGIKVVRPV